MHRSRSVRAGRASALILFLAVPRPLSSTLFPYTTLFRSFRLVHGLGASAYGRESQVRQMLSVCAGAPFALRTAFVRSEEHTSELQSQFHLVCRLLLEKKKKTRKKHR